MSALIQNYSDDQHRQATDSGTVVNPRRQCLLPVRFRKNAQILLRETAEWVRTVDGNTIFSEKEKYNLLKWGMEQLELSPIYTDEFNQDIYDALERKDFKKLDEMMKTWLESGEDIVLQKYEALQKKEREMQHATWLAWGGLIALVSLPLLLLLWLYGQ